MARPKKTSKVFSSATTRAASLESIDANLDLGNGLTLAAYRALLKQGTDKLDDYNTALSTVDTLKSEFEVLQTSVADLSERMLDGVAAKYGKNSDQYAAAGGTKKSDRKRSTKASKNPATP